MGSRKSHGGAGNNRNSVAERLRSRGGRRLAKKREKCEGADPGKERDGAMR